MRLPRVIIVDAEHSDSNSKITDYGLQILNDEFNNSDSIFHEDL